MNTLHLPVIIGFGGVNPAGRTSFHHGFHWMVYEALQEAEQMRTLQAMQSFIAPPQNPYQAKHLGKAERADLRQALAAQSFIRKLASPDNTGHFPFQLKEAATVEMISHHWPESLIGKEATTEGLVHGQLPAGSSAWVLGHKKLSANAAGQLPTGFDAGEYYASRHHPKGLKMAIYGVSDALASMGMPIARIIEHLDFDQFGVYASSMLGQLDDCGIAGYMKARSLGKRATSKQFPMSMPQMTADFINAYVLGNLGHTFGGVGACATFLYNLHYAAQDIQFGLRKLAIVGASDAPITSEVIDAYAALGALCTDEDLRKLDGLPKGAELPYATACRPFAENRGFVLGESAQFLVLASLEVALEFGLEVFGAVGGVAIHADGQKNSITKPGPGNLLSLIRSLHMAEAMLGSEVLRRETFVSAHGTGTPQNRVTESQLFSRVAKEFKIHEWPVVAVKNYLGHSTAPAAGDQIAAALGSFKSGILPGITNTHTLAEDVAKDHLHYCLQHTNLGMQSFSAALINSKGFGGNNATALLLAPKVVEAWLPKLATKASLKDYAQKLAVNQSAAARQNEAIIRHEWRPHYNAQEPAVDILQEGVWLEEGFRLGKRTLNKVKCNPYLPQIKSEK